MITTHNTYKLQSSKGSFITIIQPTILYSTECQILKGHERKVRGAEIIMLSWIIVSHNTVSHKRRY